MQSSDLQCWLESCLSKENLTNISAKIVKSTEKGENFLSDILFTEVTGISKKGAKEKYNLVLKCSKKSEALRQSTAHMFAHEIFIYEELFPMFRKFQKDRNIGKLFNCFPKYYGKYISKNQEVMALEDLTQRDYSLWGKTIPLPKQYIFSVLVGYAKFHSISVAIQDQQPEEFEKLKNRFDSILKNFGNAAPNLARNMINSIKEISNLLVDELDDYVLLEWKNFAAKMETELVDAFNNPKGFKVICHGDCWSNNYLFETEDIHNPPKVSIIDWQFARLASPVSDLSYFLFSCISGDDLFYLDDLLEEYYNEFSKSLRELGSDPEKLYSRQQFFDEWENLSKYCICCIPGVLKVCYVDKEEAPDVAEAAEKGDAYQAFNQINVKDQSGLINRIKPIVKYVVDNSLI